MKGGICVKRSAAAMCMHAVGGGDVLVAGRATNGPARDASPSPIPASYRCRPLAAAASQHCNALQCAEERRATAVVVTRCVVALLCCAVPPRRVHRPSPTVPSKREVSINEPIAERLQAYRLPQITCRGYPLRGQSHAAAPCFFAASRKDTRLCLSSAVVCTATVRPAALHPLGKPQRLDDCTSHHLHRCICTAPRRAVLLVNVRCAMRNRRCLSLAARFGSGCCPSVGDGLVVFDVEPWKCSTASSRCPE